jgi:hypothetical protein
MTVTLAWLSHQELPGHNPHPLPDVAMCVNIPASKTNRVGENDNRQLCRHVDVLQCSYHVVAFLVYRAVSQYMNECDGGRLKLADLLKGAANNVRLFPGMLPYAPCPPLPRIGATWRQTAAMSRLLGGYACLHALCCVQVKSRPCCGGRARPSLSCLHWRNRRRLTQSACMPGAKPPRIKRSHKGERRMSCCVCSLESCWMPPDLRTDGSLCNRICCVDLQSAHH